MQVEKTISEDAEGLLLTASDKGLTESMTCAEMEVTRTQVITSSITCAADSGAVTTDDRELDAMLASVLGSGQASVQDAAPTVTTDTDGTAQAKLVRPRTDDRELDAMLANVLGSASGQASARSAQEAVPAVAAADPNSIAQAECTHSQTDDMELDAMLASALGGGQAGAQAAAQAVTAADTVSAAQAQQVQHQTESGAKADAAEGAAAEKGTFHLPDSLFESPLAAAGVSLCFGVPAPNVHYIAMTVRCLSSLCHGAKRLICFVMLLAPQWLLFLLHYKPSASFSTFLCLQCLYSGREMSCSLQEGQSSNPFRKQETDGDNEDGGALVKQPAKKNRCVTSDLATCNARQCCGLCNQATPEDSRVAQAQEQLQDQPRPTLHLSCAGRADVLEGGETATVREVSCNVAFEHQHRSTMRNHQQHLATRLRGRIL